MKTILTLILALFIGLTVISQDVYIYKLQFDKEKTALTTIESIDTLAIQWQKVSPSITGYSYYNNDSTAIYETGYFYDVITYTKLPQLDQYIVDPYPNKFNHTFAVKNAIYKRKE